MKPTPSAVNRYLDEKGFKHSHLGYNYLILAIMLCAEKPEYLNQITKKLYPAIAEVFDTTPNRAERAMRHSLETSREYTLSRPTNSEFIALSVDHFKYAEDGDN